MQGEARALRFDVASTTSEGNDATERDSIASNVAPLKKALNNFSKLEGSRIACKQDNIVTGPPRGDEVDPAVVIAAEDDEPNIDLGEVSDFVKELERL